MQKKILLIIPAVLLLMIVGISWKSSQEPKTQEFIFGDALPDAPLLSKRGDFKVGVQTIDLVNKDQIDILNFKDNKTPTYDRPLKVEVWYPAIVAEGSSEVEVYDQVMGNNGDPKRPLIPFKFKGRALRNAKLDDSQANYPLIIVSHGYTGSRLLFTYLTENLASKGYVVVSIDHTESTFTDAAQFTSTLLNRSLDQLFVLNEIDRLSQKNSGSFLSGMVDASNTGLVGFSMGGYGALNTMGAGYSPTAIQLFKNISGGSDALTIRSTGNDEYVASQDDRIKAVVAFAPWGMANGVWDSVGLAGLKAPTLFVAGSQDDISMYETGIKAIYEGVKSADRYLLTYVNARHNVAPNPPPADSFEEGLHIDEYLRYADSVWDQRRMNNTNQHFVTAFMGMHLKNQDHKKYLDLPVDANVGPWEGFKPRTAVGMLLEHKVPGE